ncbi:hypothetical protein SCUCBS95973_006622 [Sporothrix curviconia]|uniref:Endo-1,3(4)-beta-glucanase n=1 Tax=Sporothrix curviconia TaxID=1260050 RepID=A0ABP0C8S4_9PEZI
MADRQGQGGGDLNIDPDTISSLHVKSIKDAAHLADALPIQWDALPKIPFYGRFFGYNDQWYRASVAVSVLGVRSRAQRVLTLDEMQALAGLSANMVRRMSYEFPVLIGTVFFLERRTRASFGFPFYKPNASFSPNVFPNAARPILKDAQARLAWHGLRFSLYTGTSHFALKLLFISWAASVNTLDFESNPKLADLRERLKSMRGQYEELEKRARKEIRDQELSGRSAPGQTAGQVNSFTEGLRREAGQYGRLAQEEQPQEQQWSQPPPSQQTQQRWPQPQRQPPPPAPQQSPTYGDFSDDAFADGQDDFDDASPIAPSARRQESTRPTGGPGASWERLRHPGAAGEKPVAISKAPQGQYGWDAVRNGQVPPQQAKQASSSPDSSRQTTGDYTISSADEEKAYAHNQAQKDFDAMLEKERKGESEPSRRW